MPPDAPAPQFVRFVSSVEGRIVTRWDSPGSCIGARLATAQERKDGAEPFTWDTECVVPLTAEFCARFDRELRNALRNGDLLERKREDWEGWLKAEEEREAARDAELAKAPEAAAEVSAAPEPNAEQSTEPETTAEDDGASAPKGKKKK